MRRSLPQMPRASEGLGRRTIMDRALATRHGAPYVHLAAFAIDVDRVRDAREDVDDPLPFGWEVLLTEAYLIDALDPAARPGDRTLIEDAVLSVLEGEPGAEILGSQLPFAVWDAIARGAWPDELRALFAGWKARPRELVAALAPLWAESPTHVRALAQACLDTAIEPPLAPPTLETLARLAA